MIYKSFIGYLSILAVIGSVIFWSVALYPVSIFLSGMATMAIAQAICSRLQKTNKVKYTTKLAIVSSDDYQRLIDERATWREASREFFRLIEHIHDCPKCLADLCGEWYKQFMRTEHLVNRLGRLLSERELSK